MAQSRKSATIQRRRNRVNHSLNQ